MNSSRMFPHHWKSHDIWEKRLSPRRAPKWSLLPLSPRRTQVRLRPLLLLSVWLSPELAQPARPLQRKSTVCGLNTRAPPLSPSLGGPLYLNPQPVSFLATLALPGLLPRVALLALRFRLEKYAQRTFSTETERRKNSAAPKASPLCCGSQNQLTKIG